MSIQLMGIILPLITSLYNLLSKEGGSRYYAPGSNEIPPVTIMLMRVSTARVQLMAVLD